MSVFINLPCNLYSFHKTTITLLVRKWLDGTRHTKVPRDGGFYHVTKYYKSN